MGKKKSSNKIRIHNKSQREYQIPPAVKGGKIRTIEPGRAIEIEEEMALKYIKLYPTDLINFDDLISEGSKNLKSDNKKLTSENAKLRKELEALKAGSDNKEDPEPDGKEDPEPDKDLGGK